MIVAALLVAACGSPGGGQAGAPDAAGGTSGDGGLPPGDGAGDGTSATTDPADPGPAAVAHADASIPGASQAHTVPATVYTPDGATPRPLVVISPGFQLARTQYASYAEHLASWGFVVVLTDYADSGFSADHQAMADDVGAVITWALAQPDLAVDATRIAVAGHSLGGDISVLAATGDARIKAIVGWDPVDGSSPSVVPEKMSALTAPLAVIGETTDASGGFMPCAPAGDNFEAFYDATGTKALEMTVANADHMDWVDDPTCFACSFCTAGSAPADLARRATRRLNVAWLRRVLDGDPSMDSWLATPPEVQAGTATVTMK